MAVIETHNLRKRYGDVEALKGVSVAVERGEVYGLLGQNGAGKTTLVKVLLGIVRSWEGGASLLNAPAGTANVRRHVGYLPEDHRFPDYHSAFSLLDFYGQLYGLSRSQRRRRIPEALESVGLKSRMHYKIRTYSKGMKQRLGIAQALFHEPEVIFLDEPTDGVDPVGRRDIREMMEQRKEQGCTIFLNSHLLGEVELICDRVAILDRGQLIRQGTVADLTKQRGVFVVGVAAGGPFPDAELRAHGYEVRPHESMWQVALTDGQTIDPVLDLIRERGLKLRHLEEKRQTLEEAFLATVDAAEPVEVHPTGRREGRS